MIEPLQQFAGMVEAFGFYVALARSIFTNVQPYLKRPQGKNSAASPNLKHSVKK